MFIEIFRILSKYIKLFINLIVNINYKYFQFNVIYVSITEDNDNEVNMSKKI